MILSKLHSPHRVLRERPEFKISLLESWSGLFLGESVARISGKPFPGRTGLMASPLFLTCVRLEGIVMRDDSFSGHGLGLGGCSRSVVFSAPV
jgi:hypothetical protein